MGASGGMLVIRRADNVDLGGALTASAVSDISFCESSIGVRLKWQVK